MERSRFNEIDQRYNDEALFLDGIIDHHPDVLNTLSEQDRDVLVRYYALGDSVPDNIFAYREKVVREQPSIEAQAKIAFQKLITELGMDGFSR